MLIALTHVPSAHMHAGLRTFVERVGIDHALAMKQHVALRRLLGRCGAVVRNIDSNRALPDCAFVEDAAVVLDEIAILTSMGAAERRLELPAIARELANDRRLERIEPPAHLEGGDVLRIGRRLFVGITTRTNQAGCERLRAIVQPFGYQVVEIPVKGSLHLKTACTALDDHTLLVSNKWVDTARLSEFELISIPDEEPWAANVLRLGGRVLLSSAHPKTAELIHKRGYQVETIDLSEFSKAEAGITCLSLIFEAGKNPS
jgi:dimethylargininase